jgi:hypothetical protein
MVYILNELNHFIKMSVTIIPTVQGGGDRSGANFFRVILQ